MTVSDQEEYVATADGRLHIEEAGNGQPALVFTHYWGGSTRAWRPVIQQLCGSARCVAVDQRGWGKSSAPADADYTVGDLATDLAAVISLLGLSDFILVGHSMGGKVAQVLASRQPAGLRGLVLVAPAPAKPVPIPEAARMQMARAFTSRESTTGTLDQMLRYAPLTDEIREQIVQDALAGAPEAKENWPLHTIVEDVSADLSRITVPVLVVTAEFDRAEPLTVTQTHVVEQIPGAETTSISGSGHLIPLERPQELSEVIGSFRDSVIEGGQR
jgi:pimeloyl-ACP methyl ester carboxylesterase